MTSIPFGQTDWIRRVADETAVPVLNRYYEPNVTNLNEQFSMLSRPALKRAVSVGIGPIRSVYAQPGSFDNSIFCVSYDEVYKVTPDKTVTRLSGGIFGTSLTNSPSFAATGRLGSVPEYLYLADGRNLYVYGENSAASAKLITTGSSLADGYTLNIGGVYYQLTSGSVDAGTPDGTAANPYLLLRQLTPSLNLDNVVKALNNTGVAGVDYSLALKKNLQATATPFSPSILLVFARNNGATGNVIASVATGANWSFDTATLTGGGQKSFRQVYMPDGVGAKSVCYLSGFIIIVVAQGYGVNGRFYWISPGNTYVDPLNYATAERLPDGVVGCRAVGDQLWLFGTDTTEIWYITGDPNGLFQRVQGRLFDHGVWEGTDCQIGDNLFIVDAEGVAYSITGGGPQRISDNSIEERIRNALVLSKQRDFDLPTL